MAVRGLAGVQRPFQSLVVHVIPRAPPLYLSLTVPDASSAARCSGPLAELCAWLIAVTSAVPGQINVKMEVSHGPVVETLPERSVAV